jgi:protein-disulfide isomerase
MKIALATSALALALLLAGCGGGHDSNLAAAAANSNAPIPQIAAPNNGDWREVVSETSEGGYRMGNPDAPVKLVEYASITCPHCGEFAETATTPLRDQYVRSGQVSWEYRPFMLFPTDPGIFMALRCNGPQPFFSMIDQLYATQRDWVGRLQVLTEQQQQAIQNMSPSARSAALVQAAGLDQFFRQRGMPQARLDACLADPRGLQRLTEITQYGTSHDNVNGTPTFFVNGERQDGVGVWNQLEPRLRAAMGS